MKSGELFTAALRKCGGLLAEGEAASSEIMEDCRQAFNVMLDSWSTERLMVYTTQDQEFTWPASTASRTLGPTGTLVGLRPVRLHDSSYYVASTISYPFTLIGEGEYNAIALKTTTSSHPDYIWCEATMPNATLTIYPVPSAAITVHLISVLELTQVDDLVTELSVPPGYLRAFIYNLAVEIAPEFGITPPSTTQRLAVTSKRSLRAINSPMDIMEIPSPLDSGRRYNIYSG